MKRLLPLPVLLLAFLALAAGGLFAAFHIRSRQALLDREITHSWQILGEGLRGACGRLGVAPDPALEARSLLGILSDSLAQARIDSIGNHLDSACRTMASSGKDAVAFDSIRESVRRDRERLGLALARYREERNSVLGGWLLEGFPER